MLQCSVVAFFKPADQQYAATGKANLYCHVPHTATADCGYAFYHLSKRTLNMNNCTVGNLYNSDATPSYGIP